MIELRSSLVALTLGCLAPACDLAERGGDGARGVTADAGTAVEGEEQCVLESLAAPSANGSATSDAGATDSGTSSSHAVPARSRSAAPSPAAAHALVARIETALADDRDNGARAEAFTGAAFVAIVGRDVAALDATKDTARIVERLPAPACEARVFPIDGGAAAVVRVAEAERCQPYRGPIYFQRFTRDGSPDGPLALLSRGGDNAPSGRLRDARLDAGRIVVSLETATSLGRFMVLSVEGRELLSGDGDNVACPRAGCVRLMGRQDPGTPADTARESSDMLRVELLGRARGFSVALEVDRVRALAVVGDRVLVEYTPPSLGAAEVTARVAIVDVVKRSVEGLIDANTRGTSRWLDLYDHYAVSSADSAFVLTPTDTMSTSRPRTIHCR